MNVDLISSRSSHNKISSPHNLAAESSNVQNGFRSGPGTNKRASNATILKIDNDKVL